MVSSLIAIVLSAIPTAMADDLIFRDDFESGDLRAWSDGFTVTVQMDADTVRALLDGNFSLYGLKAVVSTDAAGRPLVWFSTRDYSINTPITWPPAYGAYTSHDAIENGKVIRPGADIPIELGQTWAVDSTGTGPVLADGVDGAISVFNTSNLEFTCGVAQSVLGSTSRPPYCAFPLYGGFVDIITPIEKILLIFSTNAVVPGTVVERAFTDLPCNACSAPPDAILKTATSPGILIDLTGVSSRTVSFGIATGWSWDGGVWASTVPPVEDLVPLLIEKP